jgi:putative tryptophan/tyrosine transport system substrate-binding protein
MRLIGLAVVLALGLILVPVASEAQQPAKLYRLGYLFEGGQLNQVSPQVMAFEGTLRELGYVEGRNLVIDRRYAEFKHDRLPELAADLVRLKPDVIVTGGTPNIAALKHATTTVPVVMTYAPRPGR